MSLPSVNPARAVRRPSFRQRSRWVHRYWALNTYIGVHPGFITTSPGSFDSDSLIYEGNTYTVYYLGNRRCYL